MMSSLNEDALPSGLSLSISQNEKNELGDNEDMSESSASTRTSNGDDFVPEPKEVSSESDDSTFSEYSSDDDDDGGGEHKRMPLLKYSRISGSLPRAPLTDSFRESTSAEGMKEAEPGSGSGRYLSTPCQCSAIGRVIIHPARKSRAADASAALGLAFQGTGGNANASDNIAGSDYANSGSGGEIDILQTLITQCYTVVAMAMEDGTILLVDAKSGEKVCSSDELKIYTNESQRAEIIALSFDSGAKHLAALTSDGDVAIFELSYGIRISGSRAVKDTKNNQSDTERGRVEFSASTFAGLMSGSGSVTARQRPEQKLFNSFLSKLAGDESAPASTPLATNTSEADTDFQSDEMASPGSAHNGNDPSSELVSESNRVLSLKLTQPVLTARFSYKVPNDSSTKATCLALDPAYDRKREKGILVGFTNGRLIYTKRSSHGGTAAVSSGFGGVMGSLLQPKRQDLDLYQSGGTDWIEFITWRGSLVAWADGSGIKLFDIDSMNRVAHIDKPSGARASLYPHISTLRPSMIFEKSDSLLICWGDCLMNMKINDSGGEGDKLNKRRTVKCEMAWELDCVACDCLPIDAEYVAILGLTQPTDIPQNDTSMDSGGANNNASNGYIVELQILRRSNGSVISSDILPLAYSDTERQNAKPSTGKFSFLSSFATPRMIDEYEVDAEGEVEEGIGVADVDIQNIILNTMVSPINEERPKAQFMDPHLKWSVDSYREVVIDGVFDVVSQEDDDSDDSDDYGFLFQSNEPVSCPAKMLMHVPTMVVISRHDAILTQVRDVDDSIEFASACSNFALALRHGLNHKSLLRKHEMNDLIEAYLTAILNPSDDLDDERSHRSLSVRRLTLAAKSTTILLGTDIKLWDKWVTEFENIPGGLLLLHSCLPVRDPKLPSQIHDRVLCAIFSEIEEMILNGGNDTNQVLSEIYDNASDLMLEALRSWGPTSSLRDRIKLHLRAIREDCDKPSELQEDNDQYLFYNKAMSALSTRMNQSASNYLLYTGDNGCIDSQSLEMNPNSSTLPTGVSSDSLFNITVVKTFLKCRLEDYPGHSSKSLNQMNIIVLDMIAEMEFMEGDFTKALKTRLCIGELLSVELLPSIEETVMKLVSQDNLGIDIDLKSERHTHVLTLIRSHDLHRCLLRVDSTSYDIVPPIVSLMCLVGVKRGGHFIIDHCSLPKRKHQSSNDRQLASFPIDLVAAQLKPFPKILLWFLHTLLNKRKEIYVVFPNTAVPPKAVTDLHRIHFDLYIKLSNRDENEIERKLSEIPPFEEQNKESHLMKFLKIALPHGGVRSEDVRKTLERRRIGIEEDGGDELDNDTAQGDVKFPHLFAHELAYVIERSGTGTEEDAKVILNLYLEGVVSLPHAVEYVMRDLLHSSMLWETLIEYCLQANDGEDDKSNGRIFGSLLEVSARAGADLALLVSKIPTNLRIDGIRHRLVAAISDYQMKVDIHKGVLDILSKDKVALLREQCHRARRGNRVDLFSESQPIKVENLKEDNEIKIVLKPWREGKSRLALKRKQRRDQHVGKDECLGINIPSSLEIR